jgi:hypothetical protein
MTWLAAWVAQSALMMSPAGAVIRAIGSGIKAFFSALNWQGWLGLIASLLLAWQLIGAASDARHWHKQSDQNAKQAETYKRQLDEETARSNAAEAAGKRISEQLRKQTDEENRRIAGDAQSLRVSGPGRAVCRPAPAASGGSQAGRGNGNAAGPPLPPADSAAVPWPWLVQRAEQADLNRTEVLAWREWYRRLVESWPQTKP